MPSYTHTRKPEPVRAWQHLEGASDLPEWALEGGVKPDDLAERESPDGHRSRPVPFGYWLVQYERLGAIHCMTNDQFSDEYDEIADA